jgi:hypothetical protein
MWAGEKSFFHVTLQLPLHRDKKKFRTAADSEKLSSKILLNDSSPKKLHLESSPKNLHQT